MTCNFETWWPLLKIMPPWVPDLLRLLSLGGSSQWFGLACPAHCSLSWPYLAAIFVSGLSLGFLSAVLAFGIFLWPWICGHPANLVAPTTIQVPQPTRLAAYLHERTAHSYRHD